MYFNIKTTPYTILPKAFLKDKKLSLKAKGLLAIMLSLPDDWDFSIKGLVTISGVSEKQINNVIKELKYNGYIEIKKGRNEKGQYQYYYDVSYERNENYDYCNHFAKL